MALLRLVALINRIGVTQLAEKPSGFVTAYLQALTGKGEKMKYFIAVIAVVGVIAFGALNYHFIRVEGGMKVLKKTEMSLEDTYVDARGANRYKLYLNPTLLKAGIKDLLEKEGIEINIKK